MDKLTYGLMAEFENPDDLVKATQRARQFGYRQLDAYSPYPIDELSDALEFRRTWIPPIVLAGGVVGCIGGYLLQYYTSAISYPLNIGGRPLNSVPSFVPVTFEMTILVAALFAILGMLALNGLPMPYHPVFNVSRFARATRDRFFLVIRATDPLFDEEKTRDVLKSLGAREVSDVPH